MRETKYICDRCKKPIGNEYSTPCVPVVGGGMAQMAGADELCTLKYEGIMGHNGFYKDKHYHYLCFCQIVPNL